MMKKTIAIAPMFLLTLSFASTALAREPKSDAQKPTRVYTATRTTTPARKPGPTAEAPSESAANDDQAAVPDDGKHEAADDGPGEDGFSIGARVGYALPMGTLAKDATLNGATDLSAKASGMVPLWADVGYRLSPKWYVGGYFQFGILGTSGDLCKRAGSTSDCSSSGSDLRFGAHVRYTFSPAAKIAPWVGISSGYEIMSVSVSAGTQTEDVTVRGWEFIGLHLGADLHPAPAVSIGPALMASFGQYGGASSSTSGSGAGTTQSHDYASPALHEWVFFGLRGQYDL